MAEAADASAASAPFPGVADRALKVNAYHKDCMAKRRRISKLVMETTVDQLRALATGKWQAVLEVNLPASQVGRHMVSVQESDDALVAVQDVTAFSACETFEQWLQALGTWPSGVLAEGYGAKRITYYAFFFACIYICELSEQWQRPWPPGGDAGGGLRITYYAFIIACEYGEQWQRPWPPGGDAGGGLCLLFSRPNCPCRSGVPLSVLVRGCRHQCL